MGYLAEDFSSITPLKTDMYQMTMAQGYFDQGRQEEEVSFYMHWRNPPFDGGYARAQRAKLPMIRREIDNPKAQELLMDPLVFEARKEILAGMEPDKPGPETGGDLNASGAARNNGRAA